MAGLYGRAYARRAVLRGLAVGLAAGRNSLEVENRRRRYKSDVSGGMKNGWALNQLRTMMLPIRSSLKKRDVDFL